MTEEEKKKKLKKSDSVAPEKVDIYEWVTEIEMTSFNDRVDKSNNQARMLKIEMPNVFKTSKEYADKLTEMLELEDRVEAL